jgi:hypothetical protein
MDEWTDDGEYIVRLCPQTGQFYTLGRRFDLCSFLPLFGRDKVPSPPPGYKVRTVYTHIHMHTHTQ